MLPGFLLFKLGPLRESAITRKKPAGIRNVFCGFLQLPNACGLDKLGE